VSADVPSRSSLGIALHTVTAPLRRHTREIAKLIRDLFARNPRWGRHRVAMTLCALRVFISPTAVRDVLLRPRPEAPTPLPAQSKQPGKPRQIIARYPKHAWSVDRTRAWRWRVWPMWVLVAIDHFSGAATAVVPLEGLNAGWVVDALQRGCR